MCVARNEAEQPRGTFKWLFKKLFWGGGHTCSAQDLLLIITQGVLLLGHKETIGDVRDQIQVGRMQDNALPAILSLWLLNGCCAILGAQIHGWLFHR